MKIGIIQTGKVADPLAEKYGEYPPMFEELLGSADPGFSFEGWAVVDGAPLPRVDAADGWIVTGSRHGVYDDLPWIEPLKAWLREARAAGRPIVGVCFGHQILAEAFGGRAEKSADGWRCGVADYELAARAPWMEGAREGLTLHTVHQDRVTAIPADAHVLARNAGSAYAGLIYGDREAPEAISIQPHPEFGTEFARDLAAYLAESGRLPPDVAGPALASFGRPVDNAMVGNWFATYLRSAAERRKAA